MAELVIPSLFETLYMVFFSTVFSLLLGFPLGILLVITEKNSIWERPNFNKILNSIINVMRSIPFIILMILAFPLAKLIVGTKIGTTATIVPLSISATPFVARIMEGSLKEIDKGIIESSLAMGATVPQIILKVLIPESLPSIVSGITLTIINIIGYSAMAGAIGGGGLGDLAVRFGLYKWQKNIMFISLIVIIVLVQGIQILGNYITLKINKK
ncbi:ABC transporter permease [Tissierella pigra]|uniref:ABC transporter permease n=1 Tax=Tissierella pigra TaxID=2607614 RepID=A0A6N7XU82_9FIRM|nr:methionine ABC transporter permease [Tissierella pigra]MBU5427439.1 ABC transporter permease [Tissierella pigra]MSU00983.1 ABC transporter permease [Tissierella pigra]